MPIKPSRCTSSGGTEFGSGTWRIYWWSDSSSASSRWHCSSSRPANGSSAPRRNSRRWRAKPQPNRGRRIYRCCGVHESSELRWQTYAVSLLAFSVASVAVLYVHLRLQNHLPFNPDGQKAVTPALAMNTAVSFLTNTNWQNYAGESTMSHLSQMAGLALHNFVSAAAGAAIGIALIRGLVRHRSNTLGNFWVDLTRTVVRILLPLSIAFALVLVSQGVVQNF